MLPAPETAVRLRLHLLGEVSLSIDGQPPQGKVYGKMLALLAYLALENQRSHSREQLAELFWPKLPAEAARINLRQTLYHLRRMLGDSSAQLVSGRDAVRLSNHGDWWLDVRAFDNTSSCGTAAACPDCNAQLAHMEAAVAHYRGDFLAGLNLDDAAEFEGWRDGWRARLQRHMLRLLASLRDCLEQQGAAARALPYARRLLTLEPWNEAGQRATMRLLAACGRPAEALDQYENCRRLLEQELDATPEAATRQLAEQIRDAAQQRALRAPVAPATSDTSTSNASSAPYAERRLLTILHCSLNAPDSDDAEEIAERLRLPYQHCTALARQHGAHVLAAPGGSFIAYFGYPVAAEDAARNAVRAACAIQAACGAGVYARSGIHSASVVTGSAAEQPDPAGIASAVAQRLSERASASEIHLSSSTSQLVRGYFHLQACGSQALRSYRVAGATAATSRLDAAARLLPLVGRDAELSQLRHIAAQVASGHSQRVLLRGEAGIGKSRLLRALAEHLTGAQWQHYTLQCEAADSATPWRPFISLLERLIGCAQDDSAAHKRQLLAAYLAQQSSALPDGSAEVLQALLAISARPLAIAAETLRLHTSSVLLALLSHACQRQPLLLAVEDLHWADPSSLALLCALGQQPATLPLLTVGTVRNDLPVEAGLAQHSILIELTQLDDQAIRTLVAATEHGLSAREIASIVARAEGIPLFAEELAHQLHDSAGGDGIPATLAYLLTARLDACGTARRLAQVAATIGRSFDLELLAQVTVFDPQQLQVLQQARLLVQRDAQHYEFRHALIHSAAYHTQTRNDRQSAHRRVAEALIQHFPQRASQAPAMVAQHWQQGADYAAALPWWLQAGQQALAAHACAEAAQHLRQGLATLAQLPAGYTRASNERTLLLALGQALLALTGYGSAEAAEVYDRAYALCQGEYAALCDGAQRFDALWGLWMVSSSRAQASFQSSAQLIAPLLQAAHDSGDVLRLGHAHAAAANLALWQGQFASALAYAQTAVALCAEQARPLAHPHGHDPQVAGLAYASWALLAQGEAASARSSAGAAIDLARRLEHPDSLCFALVHAATVYRLEHDATMVATLADEILALAGQYQLALWQVAGNMLRGWSLAYHGQHEGLALLEYSAAAVRSVMPGILVAFLHPLAEAHGFLHQHQAQLAQIDAALASAEQLGDQLHRALLLQMRTACLLAHSSSDAA